MRILASLLAFVFSSPVFTSELSLVHVDIERLEALAVAAVAEKFPEFPQGDLFVEHPIALVCHSSRAAERMPDLYAVGSRCTAWISVEAESTIVNFKYIDEDGHCIVAEGSEPIRVRVALDGSTQVSDNLKRLVTKEHAVECTEEFDNLPERSHNNSLNPDAGDAGAG
jgi:hypothetical protein